MDQEKKTNLQKRILNLFEEELGGVYVEDFILVTSELMTAVIVSATKVTAEPDAMPEILPEQMAAVESLREASPSIDTHDYSLAEKQEHEAIVALAEMDTRPRSRKSKAKAVAVEVFDDIRRLDSDDLF